MFGDLEVGAGRAAIELSSEALPLDGFTTVHDPLYVRVLVLSQDAERVVLAAIDQIALSPRLLEELTALIAEQIEVAGDRIVLCATHTFGAPHVHAPGDAHEAEHQANAHAHAALTAAVRAATREAQARMRAARIGSASGISNVNVNREMYTAEGWWVGANDGGPTDDSVSVVRFDDASGAPIALLVNYAVQSSVMHESRGPDAGKTVTADLAGAAMRHVEHAYGDAAVALFLIGAAGDQGPYLTARRTVLDREGKPRTVDVHNTGLALVQLLGERLGGEVLRVSEQVVCDQESPRLEIVARRETLPAQVPPANFRSLRATHRYVFEPAGEAQAPLTAIVLGDVAFVGVQVELSCRTGLAIKRDSPFDHTLVTTLVNGGDKYMSEESGYERITYGAMNSRYARGAAERFAERIATVLSQLHTTVRAEASG